jgi:SAM-dependent methyltransferase
MSKDFSHEDYVTDQQFLDTYNAYQAKYKDQPRESDRKVIACIGEYLQTKGPDAPRARVLDVGCSTGNLLRHLRRAFPDLALTGCDLAESSVAACRKDPELAGIRFEVASLFNLKALGTFDVAIVNAVFYMMDDAELERGLDEVARILAQGGLLVIFDFFHPFKQRLVIMETSRTHPDGLRITMRPVHEVQPVLERAGFRDPRFRPHTMPFDLPCNVEDADLTSYTVAAADGRRLLFRGALHQPWCHLLATRA